MIRKILITLLLFPSFALAAGFTVTQGGIGTTSVPTNYVLLGLNTLHLTAVATSSLGITGTTYSAAYPVTLTGTTFGLAFGTTTANDWSKLQTFVNASTSLFTVSTNTWFPYLATPAGTVLAVDPNGKLIATTTAASGVTSVTATYPVTSTGGATPNIALAFGTTTANSWSALQTFANSSTTLATISNLWTGLTAFNLLATDANGKMVATSTIGTNFLSASTISGVSLGGNLAALSVDATLTGASYNGSIARTFGLNLANPNFWTALQVFNQASTSMFTATSTVWFTSLATPAGAFLAVDPNGKIIATTTPTSSGTFAWPWNILTNYGVTTNATTTPSWFQTGVFASSTSYFVNASTSLLTVGANTFIQSSATSTFGAGIAGTALNLTGTATSTASNGFNLSGGCYAIGGVCVPQNSGIILSSIYATSTVGTTTIQFTGAAGSAAAFSAGVLTLPSNTTYITVDVAGSGGGGGEGGTNVASGSAGITGKPSCFGTSSTAVCLSPLVQSPAGAGGAGGVDVSSGGAGGLGGGLGTGSLTASTTWAGIPGGVGGLSTGGNGRGGSGGGYGGGTANANAVANAGAGGSGGAGSAGSGGGGGGGGTLSKGLITTLAANYYFSNGAGGAGGSGGAGTDGGVGASGAFTIYVYIPTGTAVGSIIGSGTAGQFPYYAAAGTTLTATSSIFLDTTGFIGMGTTSPWTSLVIRSPGGAKSSFAIGPYVANTDYEAMYLNGFQGANTYNFISSPTDPNLHINRPTGSRIDFLENNVAQAAVAPGGNFGIGTVAPTAKLTVIASSTFAQGPGTGGFSIIDAVTASEIFDLGYDPNLNAAFMQASNSTFQPLLLNPRGGNVGIGTTTPLSKLTVNGDIGTDGTNVTVSGCGTGPAVTKGSTDTAFEVTQGTIATGCTISWSSTKTNAPFCVVSSESGLAFSFVESTTALTVTNIGALSSTKITGICIQNNK